MILFFNFIIDTEAEHTLSSSLDHHYCPSAWDGFYCWPRTPSGYRAYQSCKDIFTNVVDLPLQLAEMIQSFNHDMGKCNFGYLFQVIFISGMVFILFYIIRDNYIILILYKLIKW